jgi:hypothetical protein
MLLDSVEGDHEFAGDSLIRPPRRQHPQDLEFAAGQRIDDAGRGEGVPAWIKRAMSGVKGTPEPGQVAERDARGRLARALGGDDPAEKRGHRRSLVGKDPHIALRAGEHERLG